LLDQSPSRFKDLATRTVGMVQSVIVGMTSDEIIKDVLANYTFEHLEIAAYRNLIVMAEALGHPAVAALCRESLEEERAMARWLDERMEQTAQNFMSRHTRAAA
jgi:ferritin-like metal-binding protein YciE